MVINCRIRKTACHWLQLLLIWLLIDNLTDSLSWQPLTSFVTKWPLTHNFSVSLPWKPLISTTFKYWNFLLSLQQWHLNFYQTWLSNHRLPVGSNCKIMQRLFFFFFLVSSSAGIFDIKTSVCSQKSTVLPRFASPPLLRLFCNIKTKVITGKTPHWGHWWHRKGCNK